jgi:hypothetical protein
MQVCLFCGGDASERGHAARCDGHQGRIEAANLVVERFDDDTPDVPMLMAGLTEDTWDTSAAAAGSVLDSKDSQRAMVFAAIRAAGLEGRTDDELQIELQLDGSSERPRRWELWRLNLIAVRRDDRNQPVRRLTRTNRRAVVWIAA